MKRTEFIQKLRETLEWPDEAFDEATVLRGHEKWDSLGLLVTITLIDEELSMTLPSKSLDDVTTVGDLFRLLAPKLE